MAHKKGGRIHFYDCSAEIPKGRRSLCYDREALEARKEFKPENNAIDMATCRKNNTGNCRNLENLI